MKEYAVFFNGTQVPELREFVAICDDKSALVAAAEDMLQKHVSAENRRLHEYMVVPADRLPSWAGKVRYDLRKMPATIRHWAGDE
jgi:hypothetical protein